MNFGTILLVILVWIFAKKLLNTIENEATGPGHAKEITSNHERTTTPIKKKDGESVETEKAGAEDKPLSGRDSENAETAELVAVDKPRPKPIFSDTHDKKHQRRDIREMTSAERGTVDAKNSTRPRDKKSSEAETAIPAPHSDSDLGAFPANSNESLGAPQIMGQPSMAMLQNAFISGGMFVQNVMSSDRRGFKLLEKRVATSAFHNSARRVDPPRCHPNTCIAIQKQIYDWIMLELLIRQTWIMWMHGAAGAGKSAIMQSIAELCEKEQIPLASFFFFRTDDTRNSMAFFTVTIIYQLIQIIPQIQDEIFGIIESNPLIFDQSLESQLQKLVIQPLLRVQEHFKRLFVILIDGLDECIERAHQADVIKLLGSVSHSKMIPVVFLVASRREPQIEAAFVRKEVSDLVLTLPLDNSDIEQTSDDIRHFLADKFQDMTQTHLRRHLLPNIWPPVSVVEEIVTKSSGQFIYASVVINYISSPRGNPAHLLDIVHGICSRDPSSQNPFAHLDALYQHIFSQVEELDKVLDILACILITDSTYINRIEGAFLLEGGGLEVYLADLTAVIDCDRKNSNMKFLHASLSDFLRDKTRSERYHIDVEEYFPKLLYMFLDRVSPLLDPVSRANNLDTVVRQGYYCLWVIHDLLSVGAKASDRLRQSFMTFSIKFYTGSFRSFLVEHVVNILKQVKQLNFDDQGQAYRHVLDQFATELAKHWSLLDNLDKSRVRKTPDLLARISQIRQEELIFDSSESDSEEL